MRQNNNINQQKINLRNILKAKRAQISPDQRTAYANIIKNKLLELEEIKTAKTVFIYVSYATEVDTRSLITTLFDAGKILAVPKIIDAEKMYAVNFWGWDNLIADHMGILSPDNIEPCHRPFDIAVIPGLGFTSSGQRIGYGLGYYDKWFSCNEVGQKIAIAFEAQLVDVLPTQESDIAMDKIVTEKRVLDIHHLDYK